MGFIPETTDRAAWEERTRITAEFLGRAAEAQDAEKQAILCRLVEELFDRECEPRLALVKSEKDLPAFDSDLGLVWSMIIYPLLPPQVTEPQMEALRMANAGRRAHWMAKALQTVHPPPKGDEHNDRRARVDAYIEEVLKRTGKKISRADIWRRAGYKFRTEFERWQRNDPKCTKSADVNFRRILSEKPHLKSGIRKEKVAYPMGKT